MNENALTNPNKQRELREIDIEIERITLARSQIPDDDPKLEMPRLLFLLGISHSNRFGLIGTLSDLDKAIEYTSLALALIPEGHPALPGALANQGMFHSNRYERLGQPCDLERAIDYESRALALTPDGHPHLSARLYNLGMSLKNRFERLGELVDLDKAIQYQSRALALTPDGHPDSLDHLQNLGVFCMIRFERLGELGDLDKAIKYESRALALTPNGHPSLAALFQNLGVFLKVRYEHMGGLDDLNKAIEHKSRAVALTPDGHPDVSSRLRNLGVSLRMRFQCLGQLGDLEKAIEHQSRAVALTPNGHPQLSLGFTSLGVSLSVRFEHLGELGDLDKAIEYESRGVALTPNGHPDLPSRLQGLGASLEIRFQRLGALGDLERAIECESRAVTLTPDDHPELSARLDNLGVSLKNRFERLGELGDLDKAIKYESRALALTPNGHTGLPTRLQNLGLSLRIRFQRLGELADLDKAINYESRAVTLTPDGHPSLSARLQNLGGSLTRRFGRLGELSDLHKAIEYESRAVALTPNDHPDLSSRLHNLGLSLENRFRRLGDLGDLDKAIDYDSRALELTPDDHPLLPARLYLLGTSHSHRFRHIHKQDDLYLAIDRISRSIELTPHGHPELPSRHFGLANGRILHYKLTGDRSDLQEALNCYRAATQSSAGSPRDKFRYALEWAADASRETYLNSIEAYQTAIDLLPQFIWLGATTAQRYEDLTRAQSLATNAAATAILASDCSLALEWLEHARCVVWNQSLMLRSPLDDLASCDPELATRLRNVASQLHHTGSESRESQSLISGSLTPEQVAQQHRQLAQEYDSLISQARASPGFADFLQPIKAARLVRATRYGPVAVINCHDDRCDALIIMPGQGHVDHIPLPHFTGKRAQSIRKRMESAVIDTRQGERGATLFLEAEREKGFESILADLWYDIVEPVLEFLGFLKNSRAGNLPHITWCSTGALSFLPLHAAGDYHKPGSRVFDYVISSYTPTLTAILPSTVTSSLSTGAPRVLAIAQPSTPDRTRLPGTVEEIGYLNNHASGKLECTQLVGEQATIATVLEAMEKHDWVHLACHAHQNVQDSTKSGFFLHDGTLDLAAINRRSFKKKGLAFLSACQTATGDEKLPDEAIHLASGMLMAGYSSVIGTMWSVMDDDAPFVADKVYGQLMKHGKVSNGEAGKALHYAVAELRDRVGEKKFGRWVPYIHIGS